MDSNNLKKLIDEKYISVQKHPTENLFIYNYTQKAQYDKMWNEETMACRGLIMDGNGNVIARPFKKFFNFEEIEGKIPNDNFKVYEKYDGSLGILYWIGNEPFIATRGSFISDQAIKATAILRTIDCSTLNRNYTYLFEIIFPENRIVVDYGKDEKLVLLAIIETASGKELPLESNIFETAKLYDGFNLDLIKKSQKENKTDEGFVLKWPDDFRLKMKNEEYVRLHRLVTQVTARSIWDLLRNNQPIDELLDRVPDEFFNWVKKTTENLNNAFAEIELSALLSCDEAMNFKSRKEQAEYLFKNAKYPHIAFAIMDKKPFKEAIWKLLRPKHETPFMADNE